MRRSLALLVAILIAAFVPTAHAGFQLARTVAPGTHIDWSFEKHREPVTYRSGGVELTLRGRTDPESPDLVRPVLTVTMPGLAPVQAEGADTSATFDHRVTVGRWDSERPYVLFQSFSGGAHCCTEFQLIYPENGRLRLVSLGEWDGGYWDELPTDLNGDGRLDFRIADNAFLYAFASYAESWAPPRFYNVVGGEVVDVSANPAFRPVFEAYLPEVREACVSPTDGAAPNPACAAYVAAAARVGRFNEAWADMLRSHDPDFDWPLPSGCRSAPVEGQCSEADVVELDNYPDALRAFLLELGYLDG